MLLVAFSGNNDDWPQFPTVPTITDNLGAHLTYNIFDWQCGGAAGASASSRASTGHEGQTAFWTANVINSVAMTVSVTNNTTLGQSQCAVKVWVLTGVDLANPVGAHGFNGSTSGSTVNQAYTAQIDSGQGFLAVCDWTAVGTETAGSGCTFDVGTGDSGSIGAPDVSYGFCHRTTDDDANGVSNNLRMTLPSTSTSFNWSYIEIQPGTTDPAEKDPPSVINFYAPGGLGPNGNPIPWFGTDDAVAPPTGILIDPSSPPPVSNTVGTGTGLTTVSFTPANNSLILVMWAGNSIDPTNPSTPTIADSLGGGALTYTLSDWQSRADTPTVDGQAAIWTAPVVTGAAMTITVNNNAASPNRHAGLQVLVLTHTSGTRPGLGAHGKSGSSSANIIAQTYTAQATGGQGFIAFCDWSATGVPREGTDNYPAYGSSLSGSFGNIPTQISYGMYKRLIPDDVNTVSNRLNVSLAGTSTSLQWAYLEIVPPAGGGTQTLTQTGIQSEERSGTSSTSTTITITQAGIQSQERSGAPQVTNSVSVTPTGIASEERDGSSVATPGAVTLSQTGIASEEVFGLANAAFPSAAIAFDSSGNATFASVTTTNIDITSAAVGATCYALLALGTSQGGNVTWTGWTQVLEADEGTATHYAFYKRIKQSGDTTMAVSWTTTTRGTIVWSSYTNVASDEGAAATLHTSAGTTYPTPSVTPGGTGRWAISPTWSRSTTLANQTQSFTADAALLERQDVNNGANPWVPSTIADSNTTVTVAAHTYTATMTTTGASASESHGGAILAYLVPSAGGATQTLNASGIASEEREGSSVTSAIATISTAGITSSELLGSNSINLSVTAASIFGAEALGNPSASNVNSVPSTGISTFERVGAVSVTSSATIQASSIPSQEVVGNASALLTQTVQATGIDSQTSVGNPALTVGVVTISAAGVATSERVGVAQVTTTVSVTPTGIVSFEVSGSSLVFLTQTVSAFGISSAERFGTTRIDQTVNPSGVPTSEAFGSGTTNQTVAPSGISAEVYTVGNPTVLLAQTVSATGVPSVEQFGSAVLVPGPATVTASGISSAERIGSSSAATTSTVTATGISSFETSGNPSLQIAQSISATSCTFVSDVGGPTLSPGPVTVAATGVASAETVGTTASASASTISANSITSVEAFGNPALSTIVAINGHGIVSADNVGSPSVTATITVQAHGITTAQLSGFPNLGMLIAASGIRSAEAVSKLSITVGAVTISAYGVSTQERFGRVVVTAIPVVAPAPDTTIELQLGRTTIKIQTVGSVLQLDDAITKIKMKNNQTTIMLESGTIIELEGSIFG